jgi:dihydropteroate synthase
MGVLNVTPDSFSDGGLYVEIGQVLQRAEELVAEGAALIDIGGESTRPGAALVSVQEELDRVIPPVEMLARDLPIPISVDTSKPKVMEEALRAGAGMINDIRALQLPGALETVARSTASVCLMHMQGTPATMQNNPYYKDVVGDIKAFLETRIQACRDAGIGRERLIVDPGFGFGKTVAHNLSLLKRLHEFHTLGLPVLIGISRKSTLGKLLNASIPERLYGSLSAAVIAAWQGARIIRAHDVKATVQALQICNSVMEAT